MTTTADRYDPIVIVTSMGAVSAAEIINNIRKVPFEDDQLPLHGGHLGLRYAVHTKYYTSNILFVQYDKPLDTLPERMQDAVEGMLVFFDAENRDILKLIDEHLKYAKNNGLQLLMLLCDKLYDDARRGMTYKEVKHCTQMFIDIIELGRTSDDVPSANPTATLMSAADDGSDDEDESGVDRQPNADHHDPVGYAELLQVLQNNIWSNVNMSEAMSAARPAKQPSEDNSGTHGSDFRRDLADFLKASQLSAVSDPGQLLDGDKEFVQEVTNLMAASSAAPSSSAAQDGLVASVEGLTIGAEKKPTNEESDGMEHRVDAELLNFEKLLNDLMAFREGSSSLSRNERFAYTQNFADAFDEMIGDGPDSDEDDEDNNESGSSADNKVNLNN